jgi:hypothetical protein
MLDKVSGKLVDPLEANPNLSEAVAKALRCALETDHELRPRTATDFCRMLRGEDPIGLITKPKDEIDVREGRRGHTESRGFWSAQDPKVRIAVITALIAAIAGIITAAIQIIPDLLK